MGVDVDYVEQNRRRRRLRWKLVLFSIPVVILALVLAMKLFGLSAVAGIAISAYDRGDYATSEAASGSLLENNYFEPWIPWFNRGVASAGGGDFIPAIADFEKALPLAPDDRKCEVVLNLSLGWERLGDSYVWAGYPSGAVLLYQAAEEVLATEGQHCRPPDAPEELEAELDGAVERLREKIEAAQESLDALDPGRNSTGEERLEQLEQRGEDAARDKAEDDAADRPGGQDWGYTDKPW